MRRLLTLTALLALLIPLAGCSGTRSTMWSNTFFKGLGNRLSESGAHMKRDAKYMIFDDAERGIGEQMADDVHTMRVEFFKIFFDLDDHILEDDE